MKTLLALWQTRVPDKALPLVSAELVHPKLSAAMPLVARAVLLQMVRKVKVRAATLLRMTAGCGSNKLH